MKHHALGPLPQSLPKPRAILHGTVLPSSMQYFLRVNHSGLEFIGPQASKSSQTKAEVNTSTCLLHDSVNGPVYLLRVSVGDVMFHVVVFRL